MTTNLAAPRAYSVTEAADAYSVKQDTIRRAIHSAELPAKRVAGRIRIHADALEEWWRQLPDTAA